MVRGVVEICRPGYRLGLFGMFQHKSLYIEWIPNTEEAWHFMDAFVVLSLSDALQAPLPKC